MSFRFRAVGRRRGTVRYFMLKLTSGLELFCGNKVHL